MLAALALGFLALTGPADPAPAPAQWAVPEVITVRAPAPRLWKLTRGGSTVYVLGALDPLPRGLAWNKGPIERIMARANRLIVPPYMSVSGRQIDEVGRQSYLPRGASLDDELGEEMGERLHALLTRLGKSPGTYTYQKAGWTAIQLEFELQHSRFLDNQEPGQTLRKLAGQRHVRVQEAARYDMTPLLRELTDLPEARGVELLQHTIEAAEYQLDHADEIGKAWAAGDLHAVGQLKGPSLTAIGILRQGAARSAQELHARGDTAMAAAIEAALDQPGVSVMTCNLGLFAQKGGVIDQLRARGIEIVEPDE